MNRVFWLVVVLLLFWLNYYTALQRLKPLGKFIGFEKLFIKRVIINKSIQTMKTKHCYKKKFTVLSDGVFKNRSTVTLTH